MMQKDTLSIEQFKRHLAENKIGLLVPSKFEEVIIRGDGKDYAVAAVHTEGNQLIIDLGHELIEENYAARKLKRMGWYNPDHTY